MKILIKISIFIMVFAISFNMKSQKPNLSQWEISTTDSSIVFDVKIEKGWQLYSSDFDPDLGPVVTTFEFSEGLKTLGEIQAINPNKKYDDLWGGEYTYFKEKGQFIQKVDLGNLDTSKTHEATVDFQLCNEKDGHCILYSEKFPVSFQ